MLYQDVVFVIVKVVRARRFWVSRYCDAVLPSHCRLLLCRLPFSRLSYAAYLLHPVFLQLSYRSAREVAHYSTSALAYNSTHALLFGNSAAAVMYLLVELPTQKLEVEFLPRE